MKKILEKLIIKKDLDEKSAENAMELIMSGNASPAQIGAFLVALRSKGESFKEIAALARIMRKYGNQISPKIPKNAILLDTCGTGGDEYNTFNISTIAALILASANIYIAKHGNRSVSSLCGSADLLEGLGVNIAASPEVVQKCIEDAGIGFMFAPVFHPAMKHAIGPRKELGIRTVFNILGPLTNPASAHSQILGIFSPDLTEKMAQTLKLLKVERALTFHGLPGLDEVSNIGKTIVSELNNGEIKNYELNVDNFDVLKASITDIKGGDLETNLKITLEILRGNQSPKADIVRMNVAAGLYVTEKASNFKEGMTIAQDTIESKKPIEKLVKLIKVSGGNLEKFKELEEKY
ncbi:MAG: anthranilate phosphoribosyltransferase [Candidatus Lokiarchaeota archaeon]|nr:anthranilate phosphoribosyltransferase [Candidatus Lokiarchaeota archaeon]